MGAADRWRYGAVVRKGPLKHAKTRLLNPVERERPALEERPEIYGKMQNKKRANT